MKVVIVILVLGCVGLTVALLVQRKKSTEIQQVQAQGYLELSNRLDAVQRNFEEQERMNLFLNTNLTLANTEVASFSNRFLSISRNLDEVRTEARKAAEIAEAELDKREGRISELTSQGEDLGNQIGKLNSSIGNLNQLIAETERKLSASEGDREFLLTELKRMQREKSDLERQFNDLALLRTQVAKLKDELSVAKRLEWIRRGIYGPETRKGAEILMQGITMPTGARTNYNLNVELKQDGSATVVPPSTNSPAPE